jgi:MFS family permease
MTEASSPPTASSDPKAGPVAPPGTARVRNASLLLFVVCAVQFLDAMDIATMGPALPQIEHDLRMSPDQLQWVVSAYTLGFGSVLLLGGRLADLFGRKRLLVGWLAVFVVASLVGGLADGGFLLVVARLLKGLSAGFTAPVAMALLLDAFRDERARNRALGTFLAITTVGYSIGLVIGGLLAEITWRLVLFLPAAVGAVVVLLALYAVPRDPARGQRERQRLDIMGAVLVTASAIALVYGVSRASAIGWSDPTIIASLAAAAVLLIVFVLAERAHPTPLIPFEIFTRPHLTRANVCILMFGAYVSFQFVLTLYYQNKLGWSPVQAGLAFLLGAVLTGLTARRAASFVTKYGAWPVATVGLLMLSAGYVVWALLIGHVNPLVPLLAQQMLGGVGFAAAYTALNISAVGRAKENEQGLASGIFNASSQIGAGIVLAVTATIFATFVNEGFGGHCAGLWTIAGLSLAITLLSAAGITRSRSRASAS